VSSRHERGSRRPQVYQILTMYLDAKPVIVLEVNNARHFDLDFLYGNIQLARIQLQEHVGDDRFEGITYIHPLIALSDKAP
jgi:hypothetical protein